MRRAAAYLLLLVLLGIQFNCSMPGVTDGGSATDVGNPIAAGIIYNENGAPVPNTQVQLVLTDHNPVTDPLLPDSLTDTTDDNGRFSFTVSDSETQYNIQAIHLNGRERLLLTGINGTLDTTTLISGTLYKPGAVHLSFSDSVELKDGYVYLPGTKYYRKFSEVAILHEKDNYSFVFDSLPPGEVSGFYFGRENSTEDPVRFTDDFSVASTDTTKVIAQMFWAAYTTANSEIPGNTVRAVVVDNNEVVWVGTRDSGLASFDGASWRTYTDENSLLPHNRINALALDPDGSIWIGTEDGLANLQDGNVRTIVQPGAYTDLPSPVITALAVESNGIVWVGTAEGCAEYDPVANEWTVYDTSTVLVENYITGIAINYKDKKFITSYLGLYIYNDSTWRVYYKGTDSCEIEDTVRGIALSTSTTCYMPAKDGLLSFWRDDGGGMWTKQNSSTQGIDNYNMASIGIGANTTINKWVGTVGDGTVYRIGPLYANAYNGDNTEVLVNAGTIHCITSVENKTFYFGSENNGLIQLQLTVTWGR